MRNRLSLILYFLFIALFPECVSGKVATGAERFEQYLPFIRGKRVGMVINHTSVVGTKQTHLLDTLLKQNINVILSIILCISICAGFCFVTLKMIQNNLSIYTIICFTFCSLSALIFLVCKGITSTK